MPPKLAELRERLGSRGAGFALALVVEALLVLLVLTLGMNAGTGEGGRPRTALVSFDAGEEKAADPQPSAKPEPQRAEQAPSPSRAEDAPPVLTPAPVVPAPPAVPVIRISPRQMAELDISNVPRTPAAPAAPARGMMGPVGPGAPADSARVGTAPNGEPLYAAAWQREPYDDELAGYLSTADGPGWGLIACRTVADYRVTDCAVLDEWPNGSRIARAAAAAAWQFRVRPPRLGGVSKVGEWVRIRIDYGIRRR